MQYIGYARSETDNYGETLDSQIVRLTEAGCTKIFHDRMAARDMLRPQFVEMMEYLRDGDILAITKLDRLGASVVSILDTIAKLNAMKVSLRILELDIDLSTATGKLVLNTMAAIAEMQENILGERRQAGIDRASADGKYKGRSRKADLAKILLMKAEGLTVAEIAVRLNCDVSTIWRALPESTKRKVKIDRQRVRKLYERGFTAAQIAREMGHTRAGIFNVLLELGIFASPYSPDFKFDT